jgi:phosphate transport system substrate-binding protein
LLVLFAVASSLPVSASAEALRIGGTGAALGLVRLLGAEFMKTEMRTTVQVSPNLGSAGGIQAVIAGAVDLAVSARPLTADEMRAGIKDVAWAQTPLAFVSSYRRVLGLKSKAVADLFTSPRATWPDGEPIRLIMRPQNEMDMSVLGNLPGLQEALAAARRRSDIPVAATEQDNSDLAQKMEGSLTLMGLSQITTERPKLRILPLDGIRPGLDTLANGTYPLAQTLYLVLPANLNATSKRFVAFLSSPTAKRILQDGGAVPVARIAVN